MWEIRLGTGYKEVVEAMFSKYLGPPSSVSNPYPMKLDGLPNVGEVGMTSGWLTSTAGTTLGGVQLWSGVRRDPVTLSDENNDYARVVIAVLDDDVEAASEKTLRPVLSLKQPLRSSTSSALRTQRTIRCRRLQSNQRFQSQRGYIRQGRRGNRRSVDRRNVDHCRFSGWRNDSVRDT